MGDLCSRININYNIRIIEIISWWALCCVGSSKVGVLISKPNGNG